MAENGEQLFERLEKEGVWLTIKDIGDKGFIYNLEIELSNYLFDWKNSQKAKEIAEKNGINFYHIDVQQGEGLSTRSVAVFGVECSKDRID